MGGGGGGWEKDMRGMATKEASHSCCSFSSSTAA